MCVKSILFLWSWMRALTLIWSIRDLLYVPSPYITRHKCHCKLKDVLLYWKLIWSFYRVNGEFVNDCVYCSKQLMKDPNWLFSILKCKFNSYWRIVDSQFSSEWQISCRFLCLKKQCLFDFSIKAYFTTLDNQLWLHFKMKSKETKHMLLKPIYVGIRIGWKICEIMFKKCHKCIIYQKKCCG